MLMAAQEMKEYTLTPGMSVSGLVTKIQLAHGDEEEISLSFCNPGGEKKNIDRIQVKHAVGVLRSVATEIGGDIPTISTHDADGIPDGGPKHPGAYMRGGTDSRREFGGD